MVTSSPKSLTPVSSREAQTEGQSTNPLTSPQNAQGREKKKKDKTEKLSQPRGGRGERRRQVVWPRRPDPRAGGGTPVGKARGKPRALRTRSGARLTAGRPRRQPQRGLGKGYAGTVCAACADVRRIRNYSKTQERMLKRPECNVLNTQSRRSDRRELRPCPRKPGCRPRRPRDRGEAAQPPDRPRVSFHSLLPLRVALPGSRDYQIGPSRRSQKSLLWPLCSDRPVNRPRPRRERHVRAQGSRGLTHGEPRLAPARGRQSGGGHGLSEAPWAAMPPNVLPFPSLSLFR